MQTNIKIKDRKKLWLQILVDLECTYIGINKKLVKKEKIKTKPMNISFKVFNADRTKNRGVMRFAPLEIKVNRYREKINATVIDLNIFLGYDWLVKHNPKFN